MTAQIDVRAVERTLTEDYGINAGPDGERTGTQVYLHGGVDGAVLVTEDGRVARVSWTHTDGNVAVVREEEIKHVADEDAAVRAVAGYMRRREITESIRQLRALLDNYVPASVADYRVERARTALHLLGADIGKVRVSTDPSA